MTRFSSTPSFIEHQDLLPIQTRIEYRIVSPLKTSPELVSSPLKINTGSYSVDGENGVQGKQRHQTYANTPNLNEQVSSGRDSEAGHQHAAAGLLVAVPPAKQAGTRAEPAGVEQLR